jgi:hypothetical protein
MGSHCNTTAILIIGGVDDGHTQALPHGAIGDGGGVQRQDSPGTTSLGQSLHHFPAVGIQMQIHNHQ